MYKQSHSRHRQHTFSRFRRHYFRGRKTLKSFNPTEMINSTPNKPQAESYKVLHAFDDFQIDPNLKENISRKGYSCPTPIQDRVIPHILTGRDIIGIANTGTGKTAAFLIPLINKVLVNRNEKILIITPTRELAVQIRDEFFAFSRSLNIHSVLCIGGVKINPQKRQLREQFNFVIGTPGRIQDLIRKKSLNLSDLGTVVLDEVDRMVDIGFIRDIKYIISLLPAVRQSLFFSATIGGKVKEILHSFVKSPVTISVKIRETAENVRQDVIKVVDRNKKIDQLQDLLRQKDFEKVLIFGRTKWGVQKLSNELVKRGFKADVIHGNKRQNQRLRTLEKFKRNNIQILIATDVASRGLDIPNVSHVINYDLPDSFDAYIHRIGRTGRADKKGIALTFIE